MPMKRMMFPMQCIFSSGGTGHPGDPLDFSPIDTYQTKYHYGMEYTKP